MSDTVDANVLVYASNEAEPVHRLARQLLAPGGGPEIVYLFWPAIMRYLRIENPFTETTARAEATLRASPAGTNKRSLQNHRVS